MTIDPKMMKIDPHLMMIDPKMITIDPNMMMIDHKKMIEPKMMTIYTKILQETNLKITGHRGIFGENLDYKTIIRERFANDLANMFDELTLPLSFYKCTKCQDIYILLFI